MSKYKEENVDIKNITQGWAKNDYLRTKYYRKDNWVIRYNGSYISYWIIDESYNYSCYVTGNKQDFLEEKHMVKVKNTLVWKALHGEYKKD